MGGVVGGGGSGGRTILERASSSSPPAATTSSPTAPPPLAPSPAAAAGGIVRSKRGCGGICRGDGVWHFPQKGWARSCGHVGRRRGSFSRSQLTRSRNGVLIRAPCHSPLSNPGGCCGLKIVCFLFVRRERICTRGGWVGQRIGVSFCSAGGRELMRVRGNSRAPKKFGGARGDRPPRGVIGKTCRFLSVEKEKGCKKKEKMSRGRVGLHVQAQ